MKHARLTRSILADQHDQVFCQPGLWISKVKVFTLEALKVFKTQLLYFHRLHSDANSQKKQVLVFILLSGLYHNQAAQTTNGDVLFTV